MEAPEKIYILNHTDYTDRRILNAFTEKENNNDIEYIRTDAFVEKARKWFERQYEWYDKLGVRHCDMKSFEDFKRYMERIKYETE